MLFSLLDLSSWLFSCCSLLVLSLAVAPLSCAPQIPPGKAVPLVTVAPAPAESNAPRRSKALLAPPHPMVATVAGQLGVGASSAESSSLDEAACRKLTGFGRTDFERCTVTFLANGTALCLAVSYDCGAHTCSVESFMWYGDESAPYHVEDSTTPLEVSPDHRYLLITELTYSDVLPPVPERGVTLRIDRKTGKREPFLKCFSAKLSPAARYYVCRDLGANVLRVPVSGGEPELIVKAELPESTTVKLGGAFDDYPAPVTFPNPRELEYEIFVYESNEVLTRRAPFHE